MSHEEKFDYYMIKKEFVKSIFDEYKPFYKEMIEDLSETVKRLGAKAYFTSGMVATQISSFAFDKNSSFDFKYSSKEIGEYIVIKPHKNTKLGKEFAQKIEFERDRLNKKYAGIISMGDWIMNKFNCYREEIYDGRFFLRSWAGASTEKQLIVLRILKEIDNPFIEPQEFEKITYGQFYDLTH